MPDETQPELWFAFAPEGTPIGRCERCRFTGQIDSDMLCLLCSQIVENNGGDAL